MSVFTIIFTISLSLFAVSTLAVVALCLWAPLRNDLDGGTR